MDGSDDVDDQEDGEEEEEDNEITAAQIGEVGSEMQPNDWVGMVKFDEILHSTKMKGNPQDGDDDEVDDGYDADEVDDGYDDVAEKRVKRETQKSSEEVSDEENMDESVANETNVTSTTETSRTKLHIDEPTTFEYGPLSSIDGINFDNDDNVVKGPKDAAPENADGPEGNRRIGGVACPTNFTDVVDKYRTKCAGMLFNCSWNGRPVECCSAFLPVATEFGECFAINSMHTE